MVATALYRWLDERFLGVLVLFNALNILDAITTKAGLTCGYAEGNAFFSQLLAASGAWAYAIKILLFILFTLILYRIKWFYSTQRSRSGVASASALLFIITLGVIVSLGAVVVSNTFFVLRCGA